MVGGRTRTGCGRSGPSGMSLVPGRVGIISYLGEAKRAEPKNSLPLRAPPCPNQAEEVVRSTFKGFEAEITERGRAGTGSGPGLV